jgi:hypothetical protein
MNLQRVFSVLMLVSFVSCCTTPWDAVKAYPEEKHPPKAIVEDVQAFIRARNIPSKDVSWLRYGVDAGGARAVMITQEIPASLGKETLEHVLYYDESQTRTKALTLRGRRTC